SRSQLLYEGWHRHGEGRLIAMVRLEIVTPEAKTFSDNVDSVVIPGVEGELGVLPMHAPLMSLLEPGELRVMKNGEETRLAVGEGFVEVTQEKIAVLTDMAVKESDIDESAAEAAIKRAEEAMRNERLSDEEQATTKAALMRSLALVKVKRRRQV
ncbi:MAG: F0F1 ATP synthase subunit epsilon, partial [Terrimicrobiaceae bacterium]